MGVRLWRGEQGGLLWHGQTRSEAVFAGAGKSANKGAATGAGAATGDEATVLRCDRADPLTAA